MGSLVATYLKNNPDATTTASTWVSLSDSLATEGSERSLLVAQEILNQSDLTLPVIASAKDAWDNLAMTAAEEVCRSQASNVSQPLLGKIMGNSGELNEGQKPNERVADVPVPRTPDFPGHYRGHQDSGLWCFVCPSSECTRYR